MPAKRINPNLIKVHFSYTATDLAKRLGVHKNTIRNWGREGLPALACRPTLYHGRAVRAWKLG
jgi:DNA-binding XRE family transcriptional regulator